MVQLVWKTVPRSRPSWAKAAVSKHGSCARLHVGSCVGGSKSRTTTGLCRCLNTVSHTSWPDMEKQDQDLQKVVLNHSWMTLKLTARLDLGVTSQSDMPFEVKLLIRSIKPTVLLASWKKTLKQDAYIMLHKSLLRRHPEYGNSVWSPWSNWSTRKSSEESHKISHFFNTIHMRKDWEFWIFLHY